MSGRGKAKSKNKASKKPRGNVRTVVKNPHFHMGERSLPSYVKADSVKIGVQSMANITVPIPSPSEDYGEGRIVGWIIYAQFVEKDKCMFVGTTKASPTTTIKVPATHRANHVTLKVGGKAEETFAVIFNITPYYVAEMAYGLEAPHAVAEAPAKPVAKPASPAPKAGPHQSKETQQVDDDSSDEE